MHKNSTSHFTKTKIRQIALNYSSTIEWKRKDILSFLFANEMGYLSDSTKHMPHPFTTKFINPTVGDCYRDALLYDDEYIWKEESHLLHKRAFEHGWIHRCTDHMFNRIEKTDYNFEDCLIDATKHSNMKSWRNNNSFQYQKAYIKGWVNKCFRKVNNWTVEMCFEDALQFKHKKDWKKSDAFLMSIQLGVFELCTSHMVDPSIIWTEKSILAKTLEYRSTSEWEAKSSGSYSAARNLGIFNKASKHMNIHRQLIWSLERCLEISSTFDTKSEWRDGHKKSYDSALKYGFFTECIANFKEESSSKYTLEYCIELASKFDFKREWRIEHSRAYSLSNDNGWSDVVCAHMSDHKQNKIFSLENCMVIASKYESLIEWRNHDRPSYFTAFNKNWIERCLFVLRETNHAA